MNPSPNVSVLSDRRPPGFHEQQWPLLRALDAAHPEPLPAATISLLLWPFSRPQDRVHSIRVAVSKLRRVARELALPFDVAHVSLDAGMFGYELQRMDRVA